MASIRVCVETLLAHKEIDPAKHEMFLQRCLANADRLQRLLGDVALITRIDDGSTSILREPVDLSAIIGEVVCEQQLIAQSKGITIRNDISRPLPLTGNRSLLEAIFTNLIDNAIAYSGGTEISLSLNVSDRLIISKAPYTVKLIQQTQHAFADTLREKLGMGTTLV